jgi:tetratricopeptide (TPR) repeat protein
MEKGAALNSLVLRLAHLALSTACCVWLCAAGTPARSQMRTSETFAELAEKAKKANDENRLDDAARLYVRALIIRPKWTDGWWSLGMIQYDQDKYAQAAKSFEKLLVLDPKNGTAHAMLGLCQFELGKDAPALKNLLAAESLGILKEEQLRKVAIYHLGVLQLRAGKYGAARESMGQLVRDHVRTKELTTGMGLAALLMRPQAAPTEGTPGFDVVEQAGEAEVLLAANEFDRAKQIYTQLTNEFPDYPNLHFAFGRFLLETHETDPAVQEFQLELKRDPKNVNSMLEIATALQLVDPEGGLKYAEQAVKLVPQLPLAHYLLGMLRLNTGDAASAIPELEIAQKSFPNESGVYFSLGNAYARVGRKADAAKARGEFTRLSAKAPKQTGPTVYGDRPAGILEGHLPALDKENPPQ